MKRDFTLLWGALLIVAGVLFMIQTISTTGGDFTAERAWAGVWAVVFAGAGLSFGWVFLSEPSSSWWAAIPSMVLLALAVLTGATSLGWDTEGEWLGALFLAMLGLSFWIVYAVKRDAWWAIIPGGVLLTLSVLALTAEWITGNASGAIFFFGLAITFALVAALPVDHRHMTWAIYPAVALAVLGGVVLFSIGTASNYVWALALIAAGLWMLYRQFGGGATMQRR